MLEEEKRRVSSLTKTVEMQKLQLAQVSLLLLQSAAQLDVLCSAAVTSVHA